jgi:hypothetical protein
MADTKRLEDIVHELGAHDIWVRVSTELGSTWTPKQCRDKWCMLHRELTIMKQWTPAENELLMKLAHEMLSWKQMESRFEQRTALSLKSHYHFLKRRPTTKMSEEEGEKEPILETKEAQEEELTLAPGTFEFNEGEDDAPMQKWQLTEPIFPIDFMVQPWRELSGDEDPMDWD